MKPSSLYLWVVFILIGGCTMERYRPQPLTLPGVMAAYQDRSLENPLLKKYLQPYLSPSAEPWNTQVWDAKALSLVAFFYHPDLDLARANLQAQQGQMQTARQRPNPQAGLNIGYNYNVGEVRAVPWLFTPSVDFLIETAGKRQKRINQAQYQVEAARLGVGETAWQVKSRLRGQLIGYLLAEDELTLLQEEVAVRGEFADSLKTLFDFGEIAVTDMELARITLNDARLRLVAAEGQVRNNRILVANSVGLAAAALDNVRITYEELYQPPTLEALGRGYLEEEVLLNNLTLRRAILDYSVAEAALQLEVARQYPDLQIGPSLRIFHAQRRWQLNQGGIELPLFHQNQGPIAEAKANREMVSSTVLQLQANLLTELEGSIALYQSNLKEYESAQALVRLNEAREHEISEIFSIGDLTYLDLLSVRLEKNLARQGVVRALLRLQTSLGSIENLAQKPLEAGFDALPNLETNPRSN